MHRFNRLGRILGLLVALLWVRLPASQSAPLPSTGLMGTVKSSDGKPLEGVAVSAQAEGKTFTTSVFTNRDGEYYFPPLEGGQYRIRAQAVGFEIARGDQAITSGKKIQQDFTLQTFPDFHKQFSGTEWLNSLPADSAEDRRMGRVFRTSCGPASGCHVTGFLMAKRFDAAGWGMMIDYMIKTQGGPNALPNRLMRAYKDELVEYLTRIRGPQPYPWKFKPLPRATGEATEIVVTEYQVPRGDKPEEYLIQPSGGNWSEGVASRYESMVLHDAVVGKDGNVYFTDNATPERTVGKLDPKTGRVTGYKLADTKEGFAVSTHGVVSDQKGNIWLTNQTEGTTLKFDPQTEKFQRFPKPSSLQGGSGGMIVVDSKGNVWSPYNDGFTRLNPETGEYTEYKGVTPGGNRYGITIDAEDNAWIAQLEGDRVDFVDARTSKVGEVVVPPVDDKEVNPKDREIGQRSGTLVNNTPAIYQRGPRRLGADRKGNAVWIGEYYGGRLGKIDIHSKKYTAYTLPNPNSSPYDARVDKNHMVWVVLMNSDRIAKFNPVTEKFTEYPLPSLGTDTRFVYVDDSTDPPTIWLPYYRINKIARVQFRTGSTGQRAVNGR
ncbi:MAG: hypothetical protein A3J28_01695 [Acidobacteria bacterium RIFCSPLOWO2_12_FULL_60_22]|nr:MAG: hypothetical protein A3J28_01695 [Acidobacteria bacterium RIFCSPLOWO2_12_FULL_60_22]